MVNHDYHGSSGVPVLVDGIQGPPAQLYIRAYVYSSRIKQADARSIRAVSGLKAIP